MQCNIIQYNSQTLNPQTLNNSQILNTKTLGNSQTLNNFQDTNLNSRRCFNYFEGVTSIPEVHKYFSQQNLKNIQDTSLKFT